jgi:hypothetical protein
MLLAYHRTICPSFAPPPHVLKRKVVQTLS